MIKIAICDDEKILLKNIRDLILSYASNNDVEMCCDCFTKGEDLLASNGINEYKIVFLDVDMGNGLPDGIQVGQKLKQKKPDIILVYVSNLIQYAPIGYEVNAFGYILKENLEKTLPRYLNRILNENFQNYEYLTVEKNGTSEQISFLDITYIESSRHEILVHTIENACYKFRGTLKKLEQELDKKGFVRAHKSYIINMRMVTDFKNYNVIINKDKIINVNSRNWKTVTDSIIKWRSKP